MPPGTHRQMMRSIYQAATRTFKMKSYPLQNASALMSIKNGVLKLLCRIYNVPTS